MVPHTHSVEIEKSIYYMRGFRIYIVDFRGIFSFEVNQRTGRRKTKARARRRPGESDNNNNLGRDKAGG